MTTSLNLYEKYTINNIIIQQKLGHFVDGMYIQEESMEQNFLKRRQNFHGSELIALTNEDLEYTKIENFIKLRPSKPVSMYFDDFYRQLSNDFFYYLSAPVRRSCQSNYGSARPNCPNEECGP